MKKLRLPITFSLAILPIALVAGLLVCIYQIDLYPAEVLEQAISQIGSKELLIAVSVAQTAVYAVFCSFIGCIFAQKIGLWKPLKIEKKPLLSTLWKAIVFGIIFSLDYWIFGSKYPAAIQESIAAGLTPIGVTSAILYGGIVEELMLRLAFMSITVMALWKIFCRKTAVGDIPDWIFASANIVAALAFAALHLPATHVTFGGITPLLVFRCFFLNGGFGIFFGWLYRKYGIQYAMLGHALLHIVSKVIWLILI